ncbi:MAG: regulator SirB [Betaproteobacteria bacterium]|nr:regulator SirB [Betaproteobacteria bacterium]
MGAPAEKKTGGPSCDLTWVNKSACPLARIPGCGSGRVALAARADRERRPLDYILLKNVHVTCVALSYFGFLARGILMLRRSPVLGRSWVKIAPHAVDTLLLASAVALAVMIEQYPFTHGWLTAKVAALVLYVALGMIALTYGRTWRTRVAAWVAAQLVFFYIVGVARTRSPLVFA